MVCMGEMKNVYRFLMGRAEGRDHLAGICLDGRLILK